MLLNFHIGGRMKLKVMIVYSISTMSPFCIAGGVITTRLSTESRSKYSMSLNLAFSVAIFLPLSLYTEQRGVSNFSYSFMPE